MTGNVDTLFVDVLARQDERTWRELEQAAERSGERSGSAFGRAFSGHARASSQQLLGLLAGLGAATGAAGVGLAKLAGEAEQAQVAFTTLLGSGERARAFLAELSQFAAHTPFDLRGLQESSKKLLAFGFQAQQIIPMMTAIGDAVGALGGGADVLDGVVTALGQIQAKGKVSAEEMQQLAERGIPAWQMLADQIGISIPEAMKRAEQGAISAAEAIPAILQGMNDRFGGGMEAQSKTLLGLWSNTMDALQQAGVAAGQAIVDALDLKDVLAGMNDLLGKVPAMLKGLDLKQWAQDNSTAITVVGGAIAGALVPALVAGASAAVAFVAPLLPFIAAGAAIALVLKSMGVSLADVRTGFEQAGRVLAPVRDYLTGLARDMQTRLMPVFGMVGEMARAGFETVQNVFQRVLLPVFETLAPHLRPLLVAAGSAFMDFARMVKDAFLFVQNVVQTVLIPAFEKIWPVIGPILGGILDGATIVLNALGETFRRVGAVLRGDWASAFGDMQTTFEGFGDKLDQAAQNMAQKVIAAGKKLGTYIWEGLQGALDGLQTLLLDALASALDKLKGNLPSYLQGIAGMLANSARGAADRNAQDAATHYNNAGNVYAKPYGPQLGGTANTNIPEESGKFGYAFISSLANTFKNDPRVASDCAIIAYEILNQLGIKIKGSAVQNANVGVLEKNALASGFQKVDGQEIRPGDLVVWTSGNGKTYGVSSGKHAGVVAGFDGKGKLKVIENPGTRANGRDGITQVVSMYERQNAVYYRAPNSPFAVQPPAQQTTPVTQQPKTGTSVSDVFPGQRSATPKTAEDIRKQVEAQIRDILARVDLGVISRDAAIRLLSQIDAEATAVARRQGKGWQEYAATAKAAEQAIEGLSRGGRGLKTAAEALAALQTQYEFAGTKGLPAYVRGLEAFIAQQEHAARSTRAGSEEQLAAMANAVRARQLLSEALRAGAAEDNRLQQNRLAAERALADGQIALARSKAEAVINQYNREVRAAGDNADARLAVEQRLGRDVLAARNTLARAAAQEEVTRLERERNAAVHAQGLTLTQRQELWAQYAERIAQVNRNLNSTIEENAANSTQALLDLQVAAGKTASQLADQEIAAANARFRDLQAVVDYSYRLQYGAGDEGLIRALSTATGFSTAQVRADVKGALAEARRLSSETASIIERVYADALAHRREVAAEEARVNAAILASDVETSTTRTNVIAQRYRDEQEAAEDAAITTDYLKGQIEELLSLGRDPRTSGFADWLDELIEKGGQAGDAAAFVKKNLSDLIAQAQFLSLPRDATITDEATPRGTRTELPASTPTEARGTVNATAMQADQARGALTAEAEAWRAKTEAEILARKETDAYRESLKNLTDEQLAQHTAAALAAGSQGHYNLLVEEAERRARISADSIALIANAETELHTILTGETLPAYEARARALEQQAELDAAHRDRLLELAAAIREAGQAAQEQNDRLNITVKIAGIDTGLKQLDLYKSAVQGVADIIQGTFTDLVAGTDTGVQGILANMAKMALGIVKSVAVSIAAYQAQAIAMALISGASFNFVQAGLALAAAAAVAGIAAGLEAQLTQKLPSGTTSPSYSSSGTSAGSTGGSSSPASNNLVTIPSSQVQVIATPEFVATFGGHVDRFGAYVDRLIEKGVLVRTSVEVDQPRGSSLGWELGTGGI